MSNDMKKFYIVVAVLAGLLVLASAFMWASKTHPVALAFLAVGIGAYWFSGIHDIVTYKDPE